MRRNKLLKRIGLGLLALTVLGSGAVLLLFKTNRWGLTLEDALQQSLPVKEQTVSDYPDHFLIEKENYIEYQGTNQCAGYSSAYVLRFLGEEITGAEAYQQLDYKLSTGYVLPEGILQLFQEHGYQATLCRGNLSDLKASVAKGTPVIVLIGHGGSWQHYVTVVGYDPDQFFLADTLKPWEEGPYNVAKENENFEEQWNNGLPVFNHIYITVEHASKKE